MCRAGEKYSNNILKIYGTSYVKMRVGDNMINYPLPKRRKTQKRVSVKNRGMTFETLIDEANRYYLEHDKAVIHKKPVPVQIVNVDYPSRNKARIKEAYYRTPSTTDYNGIYKGRYIDFDVKESRGKTSFPLKNIHAHQIEHLRSVHAHGGIAFLLIHLRVIDQVYLLPFEAIERFIRRSENGGRKSVTHEEIDAEGYPVKEGFLPRIDYLKAVRTYMQEATQ